MIGKQDKRNTTRRWLQVLGFIVIGGGMVFALSIAGKLVGKDERMGTPVELSVPQKEEEITEMEDQSLPRSESVQRDLQTGYMALEQSFIKLNAEVRTGRAQRWLDYARSECNRLGYAQCPSPQHYLRSQYGAYQHELKRLIVRTQNLDGGTVQSPEMSLDGATVKQYRELSETLMDIAFAIQLRPNSAARRVLVGTDEARFQIGEYWQTLGALDWAGTEGDTGD